MRPPALSGLREARTSTSRGRGDGPGLVALQARGGAMRPSALSGLREARCGRRAAPGIATHIGTHHGLDHHRLRPAVAVARVSEAHPGTGRPGALWMADCGRGGGPGCGLRPYPGYAATWLRGPAGHGGRFLWPGIAMRAAQP